MILHWCYFHFQSPSVHQLYFLSRDRLTGVSAAEHQVRDGCGTAAPQPLPERLPARQDPDVGERE